MAQIASPISEICQKISDLRGEATADTTASRIRAISDADKDFAGRKLWSFYLLPNQSMAGTGLNNYTIGDATYPMRENGLDELFVGGTTEDKRHQIVDFDNFKILFNQNNSNKLAYTWFDVANDLWKVYISPAPSASDTIYYSYFWTPPTKTLTTSKVICPKPRAIALLALADIFEGEDETNKALQIKNEAEQLIAEMVGLDNAPGKNQLKTMKPIESTTSPRGIGSY